MNTAPLKAYAPKARTAFINAISDRAAKLGITEDKNGLHVDPMERQGDIAILHGQSFPAKTLTLRNRLQQRMEQHGYQHTIEQIAYTWFNRFIAIRYMELHDYLEHGYRVLSHPADKQQPEILEHAQHIDLADLDKETVIQLKLDGTQDEKLYRLLLTAQCNALHQAVPFLFEKIDDETELLLPDILLHSDSLIRQLVIAIPEADWANIEIIGWLYQFYISEKKDQVIGKVIKSEDIPAATQLFTPNWIVKYMVQNSLGRQWMMTYPESSLKTNMDYYIEPAKQEAAVEAVLAQQIPKELNPEHLTLIDPACGSGHILVEAYDLLTAIYLERGYRNRDIPKIILENNLYGLDIDERAAQMSAFALMMKARADDRHIFDREIKLNVLAIQSTKDLDIEKLWQQLDLNKQSKLGTTSSLFEDAQTDLADVIDDSQYHTLKNTLALFEQAETLGSLIQVPANLAAQLKSLAEQLQQLAEHGDTFQKPTANRLLPFTQQAEILAKRYDAVVANPPYMGGKGMNAELKAFAKKQFPDSKSDLFAMFMERAFDLLQPSGYNAQVNMQSWMFLSSYEALRIKLLEKNTIITMAHLGARAFGQISGEVVQTTAFILTKNHISDYKPTFFRLIGGNEEQKQQTLLNKEQAYSAIQQDDFKKISGSPIAYWAGNRTVECFVEHEKMKIFSHSFQGIITGDNNYFLRLWFEISKSSISWDFGCYEDAKSVATWIPYSKGGSYHKWYGNNEYVLRWNGSGNNLTRGRTENRNYFFREGITWSDITSSKSSFRLASKNNLFDAKAPSAFYDDGLHIHILGLMNSKFVEKITGLLNPTLSFQLDDFNKIPVNKVIFKNKNLVNIVKSAIELAKIDWNNYEISWDFQNNPLINHEGHEDHEEENFKSSTLRDLRVLRGENNLSTIYQNWQQYNQQTITEMQRLEQENNRLFIDAYGLQDELTPDVLLEQITLTINPKYRYGTKLSDEELETRFREDTIKELISYALGCMMGRYRLDKPGLIYAHSENIDFDKIYNAPSSDSETQDKYSENPFIADDDGIIPLTDREWFPDDATNRLVEFVKVAWSDESLNENLHFIADNLKPKACESSVDTIRRYFSSSFFKDHLKTYKKRPIYWLFSSGKQKAFECLVYLHRYNESTLSRMRMEYVVPLQSRINNQIDKLEGDIAAASSTASAKKAQKERDLLSKQHTELLAFDEQLRHYADLKIKLDLDDGVKVNYGKFGPLLAEVKAVTGKK